MQRFFDADDQLVQWLDGAKDVRYRYDALGRRVSKRLAAGGSVWTLFFWDGWQCVEETTSGGTVVRRYVYGEGIDEPLRATLTDVLDLDGDTSTTDPVDLYYHENSLGSITALTKSDGTVVESYRYDAWGNATILDQSGSQVSSTQVEQPFMFTGRRLDWEEGSGLYYYRLRYYDPHAGRFVSRDPLGLWGDPGQNGNGQSYCGNNPVNGADPFGLYSPSDTLDIFLERRGRAGKELLDRAKHAGITWDRNGSWENPDDETFTVDQNFVVHIDAFSDSAAADALWSGLQLALNEKRAQSDPKPWHRTRLTPIDYDGVPFPSVFDWIWWVVTLPLDWAADIFFITPIVRAWVVSDLGEDFPTEEQLGEQIDSVIRAMAAQAEAAKAAGYYGDPLHRAYGRFVNYLTDGRISVDDAMAMNPWGGRAGAGASSAAIKRGPIAGHAIRHDALGFLRNFFGAGPGYGLTNPGHYLGGQLGGVTRELFPFGWSPGWSPTTHGLPPPSSGGE